MLDDGDSLFVGSCTADDHNSERTERGGARSRTPSDATTHDATGNVTANTETDSSRFKPTTPASQIFSPRGAAAAPPTRTVEPNRDDSELNADCHSASKVGYQLEHEVCEVKKEMVAER